MYVGKNSPGHNDGKCKGPEQDAYVQVQEQQRTQIETE